MGRYSSHLTGKLCVFGAPGIEFLDEFKTTLHPFDLPTTNCNHPRKTPLTPLTLLKICFQSPKLCFSNRRLAVGLLYFVRQQRVLEHSILGAWEFMLSPDNPPLKTPSDWIRQNYSEWPQLPLSRFPTFTGIQTLAILNSQWSPLYGLVCIF